MFPRAQLLPASPRSCRPIWIRAGQCERRAGTASRKAGQRRVPHAAAAAAGGPSPTAGHCNIGGFGGVDINSSGMAIVASRDEVVIARDGAAGGRRIYIGKTMPDISRITLSASGYSVGRDRERQPRCHDHGLHDRA